MNIHISQIRQAFFDYFSKFYQTKPSSNLIIEHDPTLLFNSAGMVQFKNMYGREKPELDHVITCQKCLRVGGKHNDLDNIGTSATHLTFFEMLGHFSFKDATKQFIIEHTWKFLTEVLKLPAHELSVTVHPQDPESAQIWTAYTDKITALEENFWCVGDTGPFGYCTEIFHKELEIWNIVLVDRYKQMDGTMINLPHLCIDTGSGLERLACAVNGKTSVFDCLSSNVNRALTHHEQHRDAHDHAQASDSVRSTRIVLDHARSIAFLLAEGLLPSSSVHGYVLRKLIRRAMLHVDNLVPFIQDVIDTMSEHYTELKCIDMRVLEEEQERFRDTLARGIEKIRGQDVIDTAFAFKMYDTYGFPVELLQDVTGCTIDQGAFDRLLAEQQERSKTEFKADFIHLPATIYNPCAVKAKVLQSKDTFVVLDQTPFYAHAGGQVCDIGLIDNIPVTDVSKQGSVYVHELSPATTFTVGQEVTCTVDVIRKRNIARYHTLTHLVHSALHRVVGKHCIQKGSLVEHDRMRFDFAHNSALTESEVAKIEELVNTWIAASLSVRVSFMSLAEAKARGCLALFDYAQETVRVIEIGNTEQCTAMLDGTCQARNIEPTTQPSAQIISVELCGGTHVCNTSQIGYVKIFKQSGIASGVRRITCIAGNDYVQLLEQSLHQAADRATTSVINPIIIEKRMLGDLSILWITGTLDKKTQQKYLKDVQDIKLLIDQDAFILNLNDVAIAKYGPAIDIVNKLALKGGGSDRLASGQGARKLVEFLGLFEATKATI